MNFYFCRGCEQNNEYDKFDIVQKSDYIYLITCKICKTTTCCVKCSGCQIIKFRDIKDQDCLLQCVCGLKQRIFNCCNCRKTQIISDKNLQQTTLLKCGDCKKDAYYINCPACKSLCSNDFCTRCRIKFLFIECQQCGKEAFTTDQMAIQQYKCASNHISTILKCMRCQKPSSITDLNNSSYRCNACKLNMRQITCSCGSKQVVQISDDKLIHDYKCQNCQVKYRMLPCNSQGCRGQLIQVDLKSYNIANNQFSYSNVNYMICQECKKNKIIQTCLRCKSHTIKDDDGNQLPNKCGDCGKDFFVNSFPLCSICLVDKVEVIFVPCFHVAFCIRCSEKIEKNSCPICRAQITHKQKAIFS